MKLYLIIHILIIHPWTKMKKKILFAIFEL